MPNFNVWAGPRMRDSWFLACGSSEGTGCSGGRVLLLPRPRPNKSPETESQNVRLSLWSCCLKMNLDLDKCSLSGWVGKETKFQSPMGVGTVDSLRFHSGPPCLWYKLCMEQKSLVGGQAWAETKPGGHGVFSPEGVPCCNSDRG